MAERDAKRSPIWGYFEVCTGDNSKALCLTCKTKISRGGSVRKSHNATNLCKHLEQLHKEVFKELLETEERELTRKRLREDNKAVQPRIDEIMDSLNPYSWSSQHHMIITKVVGWMIATNFQPFSLVEDEGFQLLLRTLDRQYQLPSQKH